MLKAQGHTAFKAKAGGVPLAEDMEASGGGARGHRRRQRPHGRRQSRLGSRHRDRGRAFARALRPRWLEEPVRWADDRRELKLLAQRTISPVRRGKRIDQLRLSRPAGRAGDRDPAVRLHHDGRFHRGRKLRRCANSTTSRSPRTTTASSTPISWHPAPPAASSSPSPTRSATPCRPSCSRPAADRKRPADAKGSAGPGTDAVGGGAGEIRRAHPVVLRAGLRTAAISWIAGGRVIPVMLDLQLPLPPRRRLLLAPVDHQGHTDRASAMPSSP